MNVFRKIIMKKKCIVNWWGMGERILQTKLFYGFHYALSHVYVLQNPELQK